jgi:ribosomal protein S18 acetylase RimI-like enzyme
MTDKLWIEDVVVHSSARGKGIGRGLLEFALEDGRKRFPDCVFYLTSRPSRVAARKLYTDLGFQEYETGVFKK